MSENELMVDLELDKDYRFKVDFHQEGIAPLIMDEPEPMGQGKGPNASELLAAALGNCLSASALFCMRKAKVDVKDMHTSVRLTYSRNDRGRLRIGKVQVEIRFQVAPEDEPRICRCLELFEDYCVVTQSVRNGLDVEVNVTPTTDNA